MLSSGRVERPLRSPPGQPEVEDLDVAVLRDEQVLRLDVPVNDAACVRGSQTLRDLGRVIRGPAGGQGSRGELLAEGLPFEQLCDGEEDLRLLPEVEDREDVGMRERRDGPRFPFESFEGFGVLRQAIRENLDGDLAVQFRVTSPIDLAHASRPERGKDLVRTKPGARREGHGIFKKSAVRRSLGEGGS